MRRTPVPAEFAAENGITAPQLKFLTDLLDERDLRQSPKVLAATDEEYAAAIADLKERAADLDKPTASRWIEHLLTFPQLPRERNVQRGGASATVPSADDLPTGRYAIENEDGELRFYRLWRGTRNPNYFKLYVEHGPDESEIPFKSALSIVSKIKEAGAWECAHRYGAEIGCCSRCGLRLTNRISRALSIGPVCGGYWHEEDEWKRRVSAARRAISDAGLDPAGDVEDTDKYDYSQPIL
jgi:hypothetical protein